MCPRAPLLRHLERVGIVEGELDFRVPYYEGVSMFSALQRQNIPSRLIIFPDEGHWIGKPQNQRLWWNEALGWFDKYLMGAPHPEYDVRPQAQAAKTQSVPADR